MFLRIKHGNSIRFRSILLDRVRIEFYYYDVSGYTRKERAGIVAPSVVTNCECTARAASPCTSARLVIEEESRCSELLRCVVTSLRTTLIGRRNDNIDCGAKEDSESVTSSLSS